MPDPDDPILRSADAKAALEELVAACILALTEGDTKAVEQLLLEKPHLAAEARAQLADLMRAGLIDDHHPEQIGPYRILETLGHGGMGMVYLAEQREPVQRRVALKLVKLGMDTREVLARFAAERQALALMNHAHIAKVFDAGSTADGRPYFAMEHVAGIPITEYCDRRNLDTTERIELFLPVCEGVQHAHQKGIVHRDLKPSNVLVAEADGKAVPKIIDFGIAKAMDRRLGDATLHTRLGVLLGTPEYMSPEQAGRDALDIDARTDVYSLGVLLYELLTGELPFERYRLRTDLERLQRILREEAPASPSRRLETRREETKERAKARRTTPHELVRRLRGDLDWICLKALEKERERRYATPNELAADLRRHLDDEPVLAGPPTRRYRLAKFVRRYRLQVGAAAAVFLSLVAGLVLSLYYKSEAEVAAERTESALGRESLARGAAEADFSSALEAVDVLLTRVADKRLDGIPRAENVRRGILEDAAKFYRRFLEQRGDDVRVRTQAAGAHAVLARVLDVLGDDAQALEESRLAIGEYDRLLGERPGDRPLRFRRARALNTLAHSLIVAGRGAEARETYRQALDAWRALRAEDPSDDDLLRNLVIDLNNLASHHREGTPARALEIWSEGAALLEDRRAAGDEPEWMPKLFTLTRTGIGAAYETLGDWRGANEVLEAAREELERRDLPSETDLDLIEASLDVYQFLSRVKYRLGRDADAVAAARKHVAGAERLHRDFPQTLAYRGLLASAQGHLAVFLRVSGAETEAREYLCRAAENSAAVYAERPLEPLSRQNFLVYTSNLAHALFQDGRRDVLAEARTRSQAVLEAARSDPEPMTQFLYGASALALLAEIERADAQPAVARARSQEALAFAEERFTRAPAAPETHAFFARAASLVALSELEHGSAQAAREVIARGAAASRKALEMQPADRKAQEIDSLLALLAGLAAAELGEVAAAQSAADELLQRFSASDWQSLAARAEVLHALWKHAPSAELAAPAEAALESLLSTLAETQSADPSPLAERREDAQARLRLALLYAARGERHSALELIEPALATLREMRIVGHCVPSAEELLRDGSALRAELLLASGESTAALNELEQCASEFPADLGALLARPTFRELRTEARFEALLAKAR